VQPEIITDLKDAIRQIHGCEALYVNTVQMAGVMVCKTFYQNGNGSFHFDKQLASSSPPIDYRVASYDRRHSLSISRP